MIDINLNAIPQELEALPNWVAWKLETRDGKPTKIPVNPKTGGNAQSDRPETWGTFADAVNFWSTRRGNGAAGIGFQFTKTPFCGIDLDGCRDPESEEIDPWAAELVAQMQTYTEITASGKGLHIWARGTLPPGGRRKGKIEMYDSGRYFTLTGRHLEGTPATIEDRTEELKGVHSKVFGEGKPKATPAPQSRARLDLGDSELIQRAKGARNGDKFSRLWSGDLAGHPSQSEADLALCCMLAYWTGRDPGRMDSLFRQSGLMREKWDERRGEKTYGEITIDKAIEQTTKIYSPSPVSPRAAHDAPREAPAPSPVPAAVEVEINLTDLGNARRFVAAHGPDLRFCYPWGNGFPGMAYAGRWTPPGKWSAGRRTPFA